MHLSRYMNAPIEPSFISIINVIEYLMYHPHEPIMYLIKKIFKLNEIPHQFFFKAGNADIINIVIL